jgi:hypothetical protein
MDPQGLTMDHPQVEDAGIDLVVCDEAHKLKNDEVRNGTRGGSGIHGYLFAPKDLCEAIFWTSFTTCLIIRSLAKQTGALQHSQAATTKCISALPAKRRLLISGTPIQNSGLACHLFSWCPVESVDASGW